MTWVHKKHDCDHHTDLVGCHGDAGNGEKHHCNAYSGDTRCVERRPVLCINTSGNVLRPPHWVYSNPFYSGWARGFVKVTRPVWGCHLYSRRYANYVCRAHFGCNWRMAEHHDGRYKQGMTATNLTYLNPSGDYSGASTGGWNWWAYGNISHNWPHKHRNFWVAIND